MIAIRQTYLQYSIIDYWGLHTLFHILQTIRHIRYMTYNLSTHQNFQHSIIDDYNDKSGWLYLNDVSGWSWWWINYMYGLDRALLFRNRQTISTEGSTIQKYTNYFNRGRTLRSTQVLKLSNLNCLFHMGKGPIYSLKRADYIIELQSYDCNTTKIFTI